MTDKKPRQSVREVVKLTDLAPRQEIKGGSQRRIFGSDPARQAGGDSRSGPAEPKPATRQTKDLPTKSAASGKGGKLAANSNITLVRGVKPAPPKKDAGGPGRQSGRRRPGHG